MNWAQWTQDELDALQMLQRRRRITTFDGFGVLGRVAEVNVTSFASNDYLGLSTHPVVQAAAKSAIDRYGTGAGASRLITGSCPLHHELEESIAKWQRSESALIFPTGYAANLAVLSVFGGADVTILSDALNHASIVDGCRLAKARTLVYRHCDVDHLESLLSASSGRKLVITDVVFSMDGDVAPVAEISALCQKHNALLVLDEAHAVLQDVSAIECEVVRVGTLSKTLASLGGWIAGTRATTELLVNRARSFIFTTALPPSAVAAALAALRILLKDEGERLRSRLRENVHALRPSHPTPIVPMIVGSELRAQLASAHLLARGLHVPAVRPPSVPVGTSRLRIALSAAHERSMIDTLKRTLLDAACETALTS